MLTHPFVKFVREFYSHWEAAWLGTVSLLISVVLWFSGAKGLSWGGFALAGFICFVVAAYQTWNKKRVELENIEKNRVAPKLFLRYDRNHDTSIEYSGFFVQVEGEKRAFNVSISSEPVVGQNHKRLAMQWAVPAVPIGTTAIPIRASCVYYQGSTPHLFSVSSGQIHKFFEQKKDFPNELEVTLTFKDVEGTLCPARKVKITSNRDFGGNFEIACIPLHD